jgi:hypothetical protein
MHWAMKAPFLHADTPSLSPEPSAQNTDFNIRRVLFCRGNWSRLFQHNRPQIAIRAPWVNRVWLKAEKHFMLILLTWLYLSYVKPSTITKEP